MYVVNYVVLETESYCNANDDKFMEEEEHSTEEEAENSTEPNDLLPTVVDEYTEVLQTEVNEHEPKKRGCKRRQIENEVKDYATNLPVFISSQGNCYSMLTNSYSLSPSFS